jgi:nicotinamide phosphoribosyltransferase
MTITSTDPKCFWLVNWAETLLMKIWYPITVATKSYYIKGMMKQYWEKSSDNIAGLDFAYHNFGDRGSSSVEAAAIGGMAHLTSFAGTDNFNATAYLKEYYGSSHGFSIPATEHSTITSWGRHSELCAIDNYVETYKDSPIIACVMDSYNIYDAVSYVTSGAMKKRIESKDYPVFVIRPDSGEPIEVIEKLIQIMERNEVSFKVNSKGFRVWDKYRIIWGDGINQDKIDAILFLVVNRMGYAADNFAFGSGGDLMQKVNRDTCKFAIKCSAALVEGYWRNVWKDPVTDSGKKSKKGILTLYKTSTGKYVTKELSDEFAGVEQLWKVYENGKLLIDDSFVNIINRVKG